jgi:hypothetical protein
MELLEVCLRIIYFEVDDKFFQQIDAIAMGSYHLSLATFTLRILRN